jgi:hypothetical protein
MQFELRLGCQTCSSSSFSAVSNAFLTHIDDRLPHSHQFSTRTYALCWWHKYLTLNPENCSNVYWFILMHQTGWYVGNSIDFVLQVFGSNLGRSTAILSEELLIPTKGNSGMLPQSGRYHFLPGHYLPVIILLYGVVWDSGRKATLCEFLANKLNNICYLSMALRPLFGSWPHFQFLDLLHSQ